jgi:hypothetical protein
LNAFPTPAFLDWLDEKLAPYLGKIIPPKGVLAERLDGRLHGRLREQIEARILAEADSDGQVKAAIASLAEERNTVVATLHDRVAEGLEGHPKQHWGTVVDAHADSIMSRGAESSQPPTTTPPQRRGRRPKAKEG